MAEPLILCQCGLAKHLVNVDGSSGLMTAFTCEHCDVPCGEKRCRFCTALSRAEARGTST